MKTIRIGTRGSRLALAQTRIVTNAIRRRHPQLNLEVVPISTLGDRIPSESRKSSDSKDAFTGDINSLLICGDIDVAIHSMKDLPANLPRRLSIAATPPRGDPRDALVSARNETIDDLPSGAKVGTSSLRRRFQLLRMRRDLKVEDLYGNVDTRLGKVGAGYEATVLAAAGLERIGEMGRITQLFTIEEMIPAPCQGILAVLTRSKDEETSNLVRAIDDPSTRVEASCERSFLRAIGGDCNLPVACKATFQSSSVLAVGLIANNDGSGFRRLKLEERSSKAASLGRRLASCLLASGRGILPEMSA